MAVDIIYLNKLMFCKVVCADKLMSILEKLKSIKKWRNNDVVFIDPNYLFLATTPTNSVKTNDNQ